MLLRPHRDRLLLIEYDVIRFLRLPTFCIADVSR